MSRAPTRMPVLFIGHGSPMNAITTNAFTKSLTRLGESLPVPKTILCISAHWMTEGTWITHSQNPQTIHDFYGFPQELFDIQYPAPGNPEMAENIAASIHSPKIHADEETWGIDHGTWSVLRHMYPAAKTPVIQLSLDMSRPPEFHFELGQHLKRLRSEGVLIVGSGNLVHNLGLLNRGPNPKPFDWAIEFDEWVKNRIEDRDYRSLVRDALKTEAGRLSIPSWDHWFPLLYTLGASDDDDELRFEFEGIDYSSISMRCLSLD